MARRTTSLVLGSLLSLLAAARPQIGNAQPAPPAASPDQREQRARELFREGSQLYEAAQYELAIARFEEAYRLSALPDLLFNIAQAYRLQGPRQCATALTYYERYLHEDPAATNRQEIEELMQGLRVCVAAQAREPQALPGGVAPAAPTRGAGATTSEPTRPVPLAGSDLPPPPTAEEPPHWARWGAIGGGATLLAGVGIYAASLAKYQAVKPHAPYPPGTFRNWELATDASYALMAAGAATTIVSTVFLLRRRAHGPARGISLSLVGPIVRIEGQF